MQIELKKRIQTAAIGVVIILGLIAGFGHFGTLILALGLSLATLNEFLDFTLVLGDKEDKKKFLLGCACILQCVHFWARGIEFGLAFFFFILIGVYFLFTSPRHQQAEGGVSAHFEECIRSQFGFFYLALTWTFLTSLHQNANGVHWVIIFFLINWANDVGAYFGGKKWGKKKLFPSISPKKTWEGLYAGSGAGLIVTLIYKLIFFRSLGWVSAILISLIIGSVSVIGDLNESFVKRAFHKKDSGQSLPGHGGFLDRFDGVLLSLPFMYALSRVFS